MGDSPPPCYKNRGHNRNESVFLRLNSSQLTPILSNNRSVIKLQFGQPEKLFKNNPRLQTVLDRQYYLVVSADLSIIIDCLHLHYFQPFPHLCHSGLLTGEDSLQILQTMVPGPTG